jgi:copper chaperone CopZ
MHMGEPDMTDTAENKVTLKVEGMTCGHCVGRVQKALDAAPGVIEAKVNLDSGTAEIRFGAGADTAGLAEIVTEAGYPAQAA